MSYYEWYKGRRRIMEAAQAAAHVAGIVVMVFGMLAAAVIFA